MTNPSAAIDTDLQLAMRSIIQRIATGPELSKDITQEEAHLATRAILTNSVDPVQAAIFFIALRMKRETHDENKGVLDAIREATHGATADVDEVVDISDPYDGYNRCLPASPFLPPLLAECGLAAVSHGLDTVGPKFGVTHRHVLSALGVDVDLDPEQAAARLSDTGWAYVDQTRFCPSLHDLVPLRTLMIKRPVLSTVELLSKPVAGRSKTHWVSGYVHEPYPPVYAMLARHVGFDSMLLVRGVEGGIIPSLRQTGNYWFYHDRGEEQSVEVSPQTIGIEQSVRSVPLPDDLPKTNREGDEIAIAVDIKATAERAAEVGMAALKGEKGATYDSMMYSAALILNHLGRHDSVGDAASHVRKVLDSGAALERLR